MEPFYNKLSHKDKQNDYLHKSKPKMPLPDSSQRPPQSNA